MSAPRSDAGTHVVHVPEEWGPDAIPAPLTSGRREGADRSACRIGVRRAGSRAPGLRCGNAVARGWGRLRAGEIWRFGEKDGVNPCLCSIRGGIRAASWFLEAVKVKTRPLGY